MKMNEDSDVINADLSQRLAIDTQAMPWTSSPGGHVQRKRLHRVGPLESGQVTSIVRYEPGAKFPGHDHPQGEEILVLEGIFSDEHGDWPAGTYLLNPEGFYHEPYSKDGCLLFVKLRQFPGLDREHIAIHADTVDWKASVRKCASWKKLYAQEPYSDFTRLEAWDTPSELGQVNFPQGAELFVLSGSFADALGQYPRHCWLRIPAGGSITPVSSDYCELYIKEGGFQYLQQG